MSMHDDKSFSQRVWEGDKSVLSDACERYLNDPDNEFIAWISTLYSFRRLSFSRVELIEFADDMLQHAMVIRRTIEESGHTLERADKADVLSTVMIWTSQQPELQKQPGLRHVLRESAIALAKAGYDGYFDAGEHTQALLAITMATIEDVPGVVDLYIRHAKSLASHIRDPKQRARVWKRIGAFHLMNWNPKGIWYLLRAVTVKGIPWDVRRKAIFP